jgi:hypothetical protein
MSPNEILKRFPNSSKSTLARNAVAGLPDTQPEQSHPKPLVQKERARCRQDGPVYRVAIVSLRAKFLDDDNLRGGSKAIRDAIADSLNIDDSERFVDWCYGQVKSDTHGTIVRIEKL